MSLLPSEAAIAQQMYRDGASYRTVAHTLGRRWADVRAAIHAGGSARQPGRVRRDDVDDSDIVYLRDVERLSWSAIEAAVGMVRSGCRRRYARAHGASAADVRKL